MVMQEKYNIYENMSEDEKFMKNAYKNGIINRRSCQFKIFKKKALMCDYNRTNNFSIMLLVFFCFH